MPLQTAEREVENAVVLDLDGSLVAGNEVEEFRDAVHDLVDAGRKNILINLRNVKRIDSSGLGALVSAHTTAQKAGGSIKLIGASQRHIDLLVLTRLSTLFPNFDTEDAAIKSFNPTPEAKHFDILEFVRSQEGEEQPIGTDGDRYEQPEENSEAEKR